MNLSDALRTSGKALSVGKGPILTTILNLAIAGSIIASNHVSPKNNIGLVTQTRAPLVASDTGTVVGTAAGSGSTATAWLPSPFDSHASSRGYKTGSGVERYFQVDIVRNPTGASWDCGIKNSRTTGSGSARRIIFNNITGSGSMPWTASGAGIGPDEGFGCWTLGRIKNTTEIRIHTISNDSDVIN